MPVLTRKMRKDAGLPGLPKHFPLNVPSITTRNPSTTNSRTRRAKPKPDPVPRSTLPLASPSVLSSPTRFDAPSPLTSESSQRSPSSAYSNASTATRINDAPSMHPGLQKKRKPEEERWMHTKERGSVRISMTPQRGALFSSEWDRLEGRQTYAARSPSSNATLRATPSSSRASPDANPRASTRPGGF